MSVDDYLPDTDALFRELAQDREDKRRLQGRYAPPVGTCRVCGHEVRAEIGFNHGERLGGPPAQGHVSGWSCVGCRLVYRACPPPEGT